MVVAGVLASVLLVRATGRRGLGRAGRSPLRPARTGAERSERAAPDAGTHRGVARSQRRSRRRHAPSRRGAAGAPRRSAGQQLRRRRRGASTAIAQAAERYFQAAIRHDTAPGGGLPEPRPRVSGASGRGTGGRRQGPRHVSRLLAIDATQSRGAVSGGFSAGPEGTTSPSRAASSSDCRTRTRARPQVLAMLAADLSGEGKIDRGVGGRGATGGSPRARTRSTCWASCPALERARDRTVALRAARGPGPARAGRCRRPCVTWRRSTRATSRFADARRVLERVAAGGATVPVLTDLGARRSSHRT